MFPIGSHQHLQKYKLFVACFRKYKMPLQLRCQHLLQCDTATCSPCSFKLTAKPLRSKCEDCCMWSLQCQRGSFAKQVSGPYCENFLSCGAGQSWKWWFMTETQVLWLILTRALLRQCYRECALLNWFCSVPFSICILKLLSRDPFLLKWWYKSFFFFFYLSRKLADNMYFTKTHLMKKREQMNAPCLRG